MRLASMAYIACTSCLQFNLIIGLISPAVQAYTVQICKHEAAWNCMGIYRVDATVVILHAAVCSYIYSACMRDRTGH